MDNYDIIGTDYNHIFTYKKINNIIPFKYSLANKLKRGVSSFLITKDNKYLIIHYYENIEIYQINKMKLISSYRSTFLLYNNLREIYFMDEFNIALQLKHSPMTIMEPPEILVIYDIKDINNIN